MNKNNLKEIVERAKTSLEIEGFLITKKHKALIERKINNHIPMKQFMNHVREVSQRYEVKKKGVIILNNIGGYTNEEALYQFESYLTLWRLVELELDPLQGKFDFDHLNSIHHYIFQDIYPFAGKIRNNNLTKDHFLFAHAKFIIQEGEKLFKQLKKEKYLQGLPLERFLERLAFYKAELNVLHPYQEGSGRTIREFIRSLSIQAGYQLDWSKINKDDLLRASIKSVYDISDLVKELKKTIISLN